MRVLKIVLILLVILSLGLAAAAYLLLRPPAAQTIDDRIDLLVPEISIVEPSEAGPHPFVLLIHGCGGLVGTHGDKDIMSNYAEIAKQSGYVAVIVDSFKPRGIGFEEAVGQVCSGMKLRGRVRAGDILAAYKYALSLPSTKDTGHVIAGWSHGGWSSMELMTMDLADTGPVSIKDWKSAELTGLQGVYLTYPYCGFPASADQKPWVYTPKTSVVIAENDTVVKMGKCARTLQRMDRDGVPLEVEILEGVTHAFDESDQTEGSNFIYDEENATKALLRFASFLEDLQNDAPFPNPDRFFVDVEGADKYE